MQQNGAPDGGAHDRLTQEKEDQRHTPDPEKTAKPAEEVLSMCRRCVVVCLQYAVLQDLKLPVGVQARI